MHDPATSPTSPAAHARVDDLATPSPEPLFTPAHIAVATALATPVAGALLAAANARALGRANAARALVGFGVVVTAAIFGVDAWGAGPFTLLALPASALVAFVAATAVWGASVAHAGARSGRGVVVTVALVWLGLGVVGGSVAGALHLRAPSVDETLGDTVVHGVNERVRFVGGARRDDAERVARALAAGGWFDGTRTLRVTVDRGGGDLRLTLRAPADARDEELAPARAMFKSLARHLGACVDARVLTPDGDERATGRMCP